jgi:hypothetical protein
LAGGLAVALLRAAADAGRLSPLPRGRWPAVTQHSPPRHAKAAAGPSSAPDIVSPRKITVEGAFSVSVAAQPQTLEQ